MSLLDYINPFNRVVDKAANVIDKVVVDKDARIQIHGEVEKVRMAGLQQVEQSHQVALQVKTVPLLDGVHKLARPAMNSFAMWASYQLVQDWTAAGTVIGFNHVLLLAALWGPSGLYTVMKGRGKP